MAGYDFEFYETGTISVTNGQKAFTGSGTAWKVRGCEGALVVVSGAGTVNFVSSLSTDSAGEFRTAWSGPTLNNAKYTMWLPPSVAATALANHQRMAEIIASINTAQPASDVLAGLAAISPVADRLLYATGAKTFGLSALTAFMRSALAQSDGDGATSALRAIRQGGGAGQGDNKIRIGWGASGGGLKLQVDSTDIGIIWTDANAPKSLGASGYFKLPNGVIVNFGRGSGVNSYTFSAAFPNGLLFASAMQLAVPTTTARLASVSASSISTSSITWEPRYVEGATVGTTGVQYFWFVVGY